MTRLDVGLQALTFPGAEFELASGEIIRIEYATMKGWRVGESEVQMEFSVRESPRKRLLGELVMLEAARNSSQVEVESAKTSLGAARDRRRRAVTEISRIQNELARLDRIQVDR